MRPIPLFLVAAIAAPAMLRATPPESTNTIVLRRLVIESTSLPDQDQLRLRRTFENKSYEYGKLELQAHVENAVRDLGYFRATVDLSNLSHTADGSTATVKITAGPRYRFGEIRFQGSTIFSNEQLRQTFAVQSDDLYSATQAGKGLEALREAYATKGYINCVATPVLLIDDTGHIIGLNLSIDEGAAFHFGKLFLDGVERRPGDAAALTRSWTHLTGKRFDSRILDRWLRENQSACPRCTRSRNVDIQRSSLESGIANVHLSLPSSP